MAKVRVLIVDDEPMIRWMLNEALRGWGYETAEAGTVSAALTAFESEQPQISLLDINLPDGTGLDLLIDIKRRQPQAIVIMITGNVTVDDTIAALRGGAYDFIGKPVNLSELQVTIRNALEAGQLRKEVEEIRRERTSQFNFDQILGKSAAMTELLNLARKVSVSEASSVLLQGESGTGKDLVAKAIHYSSSRAGGPFVAINCAAIPGTLMESELFGHEKGAFTDAKARKEGLFEQAEGGTIFLDEIGEVELNLQAKLLRVLEEGTFRRVGGLKNLPLDARVVASSNRDLKSESDAGKFRLDLYYRLSVIQVDLPALRERDDDVLVLADAFIGLFNARLRRKVRGLKPEVADLFRRYPWPGNVRELRNVIERVMILEDDDLISATYLPRNLMSNEVPRGNTHSKPQTASENEGPPIVESPDSFKLPASGIDLEDTEMSFVRQAMERSGGNQTKAAELLGITRDQLRYRLKKLEERSIPQP